MKDNRWRGVSNDVYIIRATGMFYWLFLIMQRVHTTNSHNTYRNVRHKRPPTNNFGAKLEYILIFMHTFSIFIPILCIILSLSSTFIHTVVWLSWKAKSMKQSIDKPWANTSLLMQLISSWKKDCGRFWQTFKLKLLSSTIPDTDNVIFHLKSILKRGLLETLAPTYAYYSWIRKLNTITLYLPSVGPRKSWLKHVRSKIAFPKFTLRIGPIGAFSLTNAQI